VVTVGWEENYGHEKGSEQRTEINGERELPNSQWTQNIF
jgi:hypothetical protein